MLRPTLIILIFARVGSVDFAGQFPARGRTERFAQSVWRRLTDARPKDPVIAAQVADLFRQAEMVDDAISLYLRAIELAPAAAQYREYLGEYYHTLKRRPMRWPHGGPSPRELIATPRILPASQRYWPASGITKKRSRLSLKRARSNPTTSVCAQVRRLAPFEPARYRTL